MTKRGRHARCRRLEAIGNKMTDKTLNLYDKGRMEDFWDAVSALDLFLDMKDKVCGDEK